MKSLLRVAVYLSILVVFGATIAQAGVVLPPLDPTVLEGTQSINGNQEASIQFNNFTNLTVDVNWIDYSGVETFYNTLGPGQGYQQGTFITHPWVIEVNGTDAPIVGFLAVTPQPSSTTSPDIANIGAPTPEPGTMLLLGSGLTGLVSFARKRVAVRS